MDRPGIISVGWIMYLCVRLPVVERLRTRVHTAIGACHHSGWLTGRFRLKNQSVFSAASVNLSAGVTEHLYTVNHLDFDQCNVGFFH